MKKPKVSIVCTVYKHEPYLRQCFDGFLMQKTTFPIEVLVNDDCSPDDSVAIIHEYEIKYPDLFKCVYQRENQYSKGLLPWFEVLLPMANGEYIAMCEGDDYWTDPYKIQKQVDFMDTNNEYVACFHNAVVDYGTSKSLFNHLDENHFPTTEDIILRKWFISTQTLLFRNVLTKFPEWRRGIKNEDYLLELLLAKVGKFYYMDDVMAVYRQEGQGVSTIMNRDKLTMYDGIIFLLSNMKEEYNGMYSDTFDRSILNYEKLKQDFNNELFFNEHPLFKLFRLKTYKKALKIMMNLRGSIK